MANVFGELEWDKGEAWPLASEIELRDFGTTTLRMVGGKFDVFELETMKDKG